MLTRKNKLSILCASILLVAVIAIEAVLFFIPLQPQLPNYDLLEAVPHDSDDMIYHIAMNDKSVTGIKGAIADGGASAIHHALQNPHTSVSPAHLMVAGNRYILIPQGFEWLEPYQYTAQGTVNIDEVTYTIYEAERSGNLGMFYTNVIGKSSWTHIISTNPIGQYGVPLSSAVIDHALPSSLPNQSLGLGFESTISSNYLSLDFTVYDGYEIYFYIKDIPAFESELTITDDTTSKRIPIHHEGGELVVYMGHQWEGDINVSIVGDWQNFDSENCQILALSMEEYRQAGNRPRWENVSIRTNKNNFFSSISGSLNTTVDGYFQLAVPNHMNWSALLDGNPVTITETMQNYMLITVPAGNHTITFQYISPVFYILIGVLAAAVLIWVLVLVVVLVLRYRRLHPRAPRPPRVRKPKPLSAKRKRKEVNAFPPSATKKYHKRKKRKKHKHH